MVAHGGATGAALCFFPARHPRTSGRIMLGLRGKELLEVHQAGGNAQTSWLLGGLECAIQDGAIYFATPLDALFILLPLLETARGAAGGEHRGLFKPLSDIFGPDDASLEERLASLPGLNEKLVRDRTIRRRPFTLRLLLISFREACWPTLLPAQPAHACSALRSRRARSCPPLLAATGGHMRRE